MAEGVGINVDARNLYGILTVISFLILLPLSLCVEGYDMEHQYAVGVAATSACEIWVPILISGIAYYFYNECAFSALELVSPVTHAVGSTFKRVFIIFGAILYFRNYPSTLGYVGIAIAIGGVGCYSLAKVHFPPNKAPVAVDNKTMEEKQCKA